MAGERLSYLLDVYFFTQEDIDLNSQVMLWPEKIRPIFEQSEAVCLHIKVSQIIRFSISIKSIDYSAAMYYYYNTTAILLLLLLLLQLLHAEIMGLFGLIILFVEDFQ